MDFLTEIFVLLHLLGMAAIIGGWLATRWGGGTIAPVVWGARAQLVTGLILVAFAETGDDPVNHPKIGVKLLVAIAVAACAEMAAGRVKRGGDRRPLLDAAGGLAVLNATVAVLWT